MYIYKRTWEEFSLHLVLNVVFHFVLTAQDGGTANLKKQFHCAYFEEEVSILAKAVVRFPGTLQS